MSCLAYEARVTIAGCVEDTFRAMLLFRTISVPCIEDTGGVFAAAYREDTSGQDMSPCIEDTLTIPNCMEVLTHWEGRVCLYSLALSVSIL